MIQINESIHDRNSAVSASRKSVDDDTGNELLEEADDVAETYKNSSNTIDNKNKIRPFRGIIRNALQRKMRLKSGKYF